MERDGWEEILHRVEKKSMLSEFAWQNCTRYRMCCSVGSLLGKQGGAKCIALHIIITIIKTKN